MALTVLVLVGIILQFEYLKIIVILTCKYSNKGKIAASSKITQWKQQEQKEGGTTRWKNRNLRKQTHIISKFFWWRKMKVKETLT